MKAILFSGVHGVGKGFFLDKIRDSIQQYNIYTASRLIEKYQPSTDAGYKKVRDVNSNQEVLIKAIEEAKNQDKKNFILDGHLCIFNAIGEVERIPEFFFVRAQIDGIVLLQDEPNLISERINQRDATKIGEYDLAHMQEAERKYAQELKEKLHINYIIISHECNGEEFCKKLSILGGNCNE